MGSAAGPSLPSATCPEANHFGNHLLFALHDLKLVLLAVLVPAWTRDTQSSGDAPTLAVCAQGCSLGAGETLGQACGHGKSCPGGWRRLPLLLPALWEPLPAAGREGCSLPQSLHLPLKLLLAGHTVSVAILGRAQPLLSALRVCCNFLCD